MPLSIIKVIYHESEDQETWYATPAQLGVFGLNNGDETVTLSMGSLDKILNITISHDMSLNDNELCLSADLKGKVFIPENVELQVRMVDRRLDIGPLIGIFISPTKVLSLTFKNRDDAYERLVAASRALSGLCCFFSISDIDWESKLVKGVFLEKQEWVSSVCPLPRVIYDLCYGNESRQMGRQLRGMLGQGYHVVNAMTNLNKWDTYNILKKYPDLTPHLPDTILYRSSSDIETALQKHERAYFKPTGLSRGRGVFRLSRDPLDGYQVKYRNHPNNEVLYLTNLSDLDKLISKYGKIGKGYLIQEALQLSTFIGNPFDLRMLCQKDWRGTWQPSGIAVRIAASGSIITGPRSGGTVEEFPVVLKEVFNEDVTDETGLYQKFIKIGLAVAKAIDEQHGDCVELGLDMAIDKNRKIWIIEVNGKPLRVSLKKLNNPSIWARCHYRPIEYAVYLTGFVSTDLEQMGFPTAQMVQEGAD